MADNSGHSRGQRPPGHPAPAATPARVAAKRPPPNEKYANELHRKLLAFKTAQEWSDFIGLLSALDSTFKTHNATHLVHLPLLVKRLSQCLNPVLPAGVHQKTLETYGLILERLDHEELLQNFSSLALPLLTFGPRCRIVVTGDYLDLIERHVVPLASEVPLENILLALLPMMESESSDYFKRTYLLILSMSNVVRGDLFYRALFRNYVEYPDLQVCVSLFLLNTRRLAVPDYRLAASAFCSGLACGNVYVLRSTYDFITRDFPVDLLPPTGGPEAEALAPPTEQLAEQAEGTADIGDGTHAVSDVIDSMARAPADALREDIPDGPAVPSRDETLSAYAEADANVGAQPSIDIVYMGGTAARFPSPQFCNAQLARCVLLGLLKKEAGINRRIFKWFGIAAENTSPASTEHIIRGLATFINDNEEDLAMFWRLLYSLSDREDLTAVIIDNLVYSVLFFAMRVSRADSGAAKRFSKLISSFAYDYIWRMFYKKLDSAFETTAQSPATVSSDEDAHEGVAEVVDVIVYTLKELEIADTEVKTIHLPLLSNLLVRNKGKVLPGQFYYFLATFVHFAEQCPGKRKIGSIGELINKAYEKGSLSELADVDLLDAVCYELGDTELYRLTAAGGGSRLYIRDLLGSTEPIYLCNGIVETDYVSRASEDTPPVYFSKHDCLLFQQLMSKFGCEIFPNDFLKIFSKFLIKNHNYVSLLDLMKKYIPRNVLAESLWQEYLEHGNPFLLLLHDFSDFFIERVSHLDKDSLLLLLDYSMNVGARELPVRRLEAGRYALDGYDIAEYCRCGEEAPRPLCRYDELLFSLSIIMHRKSDDFLKLLMSISEPTPLLVFVLEKVYSSGVEASEWLYVEQPNFGRVLAALRILDSLLDSITVQRILSRDGPASIAGLAVAGLTGCDGLLDAITKTLCHLIVTGHEEYAGGPPGDGQGADSPMYSRSISSIRTNKKEKDLHAQMIDRPEAPSTATIEEGRGFPSPEGFHLSMKGGGSTTGQKEVQRRAFYLLYKMAKNEIPARPFYLDAIKRAISQYHGDFLVLKWSLFLVLDDIDFVIENYLFYFRDFFAEIAKTSAAETFFSRLLKRTEVCTLPLLIEIVNMLGKRRHDHREIYRVAMDVLVQSHSHSEQPDGPAGAAAGRAEPLYSKMKNLSLASARSEYKQSFGQKAFGGLHRRNSELLSAELTQLLWEFDPAVFVESIAKCSAPLRVFEAVPFKADLFKKMLSPSNVQLLHQFARLLDAPLRVGLFLSEYDFFRSLVHSRVDYSSAVFILDMLETAPASAAAPSVPPDRLRFILSNVLYSLDTRISAGGKLSLSFDYDLDILTRVFGLISDDPETVGYYRSCLFNLLGYKKYSDQAFVLIYRFILKNPESKPFTESFIGFVNGDDFFRSFLIQKSEVIRVLSTATSLNGNEIPISFSVSPLHPFVERLFSNLDSSYFLSQQSNTLQKTHALHRISFVILSNPQDFLEDWADRLISAISNLITENTNIKTEVYLLISVLMLKVQHDELVTLNSLLLGDILDTLSSMSTLTAPAGLDCLFALVQCIDVALWSRSQIFEFKSILSDGSFLGSVLQAAPAQPADSCLTNNKHYRYYRSNTRVHSRMRGAKYYQLLFTRPATLSDVHEYLREAAAFYEWTTYNFLQKDSRAATEYLLSRFKSDED